MKEKIVLSAGDVVLLSIGAMPHAFLHIVNIQRDPNAHNCTGYLVTFTKLEIPAMTFMWKLEEDHINNGWTMSGIPYSLVKVSSPAEVKIVKSEQSVITEPIDSTIEGDEFL